MSAISWWKAGVEEYDFVEKASATTTTTKKTTTTTTKAKSDNNYLSSIDYEILDIQFRTAVSIFSEEQVYCFSAMIIYKVN